MYRLMLVAIVVGMLVSSLLAGCGGSTSGTPETSGVTLSGAVYEPAAGVTALAAQPTAAANCPVVALQARTRAQLGSGRTNSQGAYSLTGLPLGEDVEVTATLPSGDLLRTRLRLRDLSCQANLDENTTMAAACRRLLDATVVTPTQEDEVVDEIAGELSYQYQNQHRYAYRKQQGQAPAFSDETQVEAAALELLDSATGSAVGTALNTRTRADGDNAVAMIVATLRVRERMQFSWDAATRTQAALALQNQIRRSSGEAAAAAASVLGVTVSAGDVDQARDRLRQRIHEFDGASLEAGEALASLCLGDADMDRIRLKTQDQVRDCLNALVTE